MSVTLAPAPSALPKVWPLSVAAYHALDEMGLIPERTELLYGTIYYKVPKTPRHSLLSQRSLRLLQRAVPSGVMSVLSNPSHAQTPSPSRIWQSFVARR